MSNLKGKTYKFLLLCVRFQGNFEVFTKWKRNKFTGHIIIFQEANYTVPYSGLKIEESIAHPLVKIHDFISSQLNPSLPSKDKRTCSIHTIMYLYYCQTIFFLACRHCSRISTRVYVSLQHSLWSWIHKVNLEGNWCRILCRRKTSLSVNAEIGEFFVFLMKSANITLGL